MDPFWWLAASNSLQIDVGKLSLLNLNPLPRLIALAKNVLCWRWPGDYNLHRSLHVPWRQIFYNPTDPHGRSFKTLQGMLFPNRYSAISRVYLDTRKAPTIERWTKAQIFHRGLNILTITFTSRYGKHMLVGGWQNPSEKYEFVNWDHDIPSILKDKSHVPVTTNQTWFPRWTRRSAA